MSGNNSTWRVATGACRLRGVTKNSSCCNSVDNGWTDCVDIWYLCSYMPISYAFYKRHGWNASTCTPRFCISGTAWPIVFKFSVWVRAINYVLSTSHGWGASARAHVLTPFPYLGNRWAHWTGIWWVVRDPVAVYASLWLGTSARAHMHTPSPYLRNWLTDCAQIWRMARYPIVTMFAKVGGGGDCTFARAFVSETAEPCTWSHAKSRPISFAFFR